MRSSNQANIIAVDTWATIVGNPNAPAPEFFFSDSNEWDSANAIISEGEKSLIRIEFPLRHWKDSSEGVLRTQILVETVNFYFSDPTVIEVAMRDELTSAKNQHSNQFETLVKKNNLIRFKYEIKLGIGVVRLARKLKGDEGVFPWFLKANYDPLWFVELMQLLINEAPQRIQPSTRIQPRIDGLQKRIHHFKLLIEGQTDVAENLRNEQSARSDEILATFTPSTV